jgi:hypothetical protein
MASVASIAAIASMGTIAIIAVMVPISRIGSKIANFKSHPSKHLYLAPFFAFSSQLSAPCSVQLVTCNTSIVKLMSDLNESHL